MIEDHRPVVHEGDVLARDLLAQLARKHRRIAVDRISIRRVQQVGHQSARHIRRKHHCALTRRHSARAQLAQRTLCGNTPNLLGALQQPRRACARVPGARLHRSTRILRNRRRREPAVAPSIFTRESTRVHHYPPRRTQVKPRTATVLDARIHSHRRRLATLRNLYALLRRNAVNVLEVQRQFIDCQRPERFSLRQAGKRIHARHLRKLHRAADQPRDSILRQLRAGRVGCALPALGREEHPQPYGPRARLRQLVHLPHAHVHRELISLKRHRLGVGRTRPPSHLHCLRGQICEFCLCRVHLAVPPTVMRSSFTVGIPTPTGTLCPFFPHVPMPSSSARSFPTMDTYFSDSGPLPISVAPFTGAVTLPSSIRYASLAEKTNLPFVMSTCPPPKFTA